MLVAERNPQRRSRFAVRWLQRLLEEDGSLTIEEARMAASCLSALGGPSHEEAYGMLAAMAERATCPLGCRRLSRERESFRSRHRLLIVATRGKDRASMAVEIKLSDGTTLRTGSDEILDDLVRAFRERQQAYVPVHTEEGETFH
jgi:hypothetical protein